VTWDWAVEVAREQSAVQGSHPGRDVRFAVVDLTTDKMMVRGCSSRNQ
jgi:hypothetical protein